MLPISPIIFFTLLSSAIAAPLIASFYGDSFAYVPYEDARATTDAKLQFKTPFAYGLLLAALGTRDYLVIYMEDASVKVRLNLGTGELVLRTNVQRFDDSRWHTVSVERENETATLVVDGELVSSARAPGRSTELNLDLGVFVADLGWYYAQFEPTMNPTIRPRSFAAFRGCLLHVAFNAESVLELARTNEQQRASASRPFPRRLATMQVDYSGCATEFDAYASDQLPGTVSLLNNASYFALPAVQFQVGGTLAFELRTTALTGVVLINHDLPNSLNFLAVELFNGYVTLTYSKSGEITRLQSGVYISDASWHAIAVSVAAQTITLKVDGRARTHQANAGDYRISLTGRLHFNGVPARGRHNAVLSQLYLATQQMMSQLALESGCVRNIMFEEIQFTIRDFVATWQVRPDCVWRYPCSQQPCVAGATCLETGLEDFECVCANTTSSEPAVASRSCVKPDFNTDYLLVSANELDELTFVVTEPIVVNEGGSTIVSSSSHINFIYNYRALNLTESQILFNVTQNPAYGRVELSVAGRSSSNRFTLRDLEDNKVRYVHDGSEELSDSMTISIQFLCKSDQLPLAVVAAQRRGIRFVLVVSVIQHNDVPRIILQRGDNITLIRNTRYFITTDLLTAADDDDLPANLKYLVEYEGGTAGGYFDRVNGESRPGRQGISSFTQQEVQERQIFYYNRGAAFARVRLRVTDNRAESDAVIITFRGIELQIRTVNKTGTTIKPGTAVVISSQQLATVSTISDVDVRYELTSVPLYGHIQRLRLPVETADAQSSLRLNLSDSQYWLTTRTFTQRQIDAGQIRYIHTEFANVPARPFEDSFRFVPICVGVRGVEETFLIRFFQVELRLVANRLLELDAQSPTATVSSSHLLASTNTDERPEEIVYVLSAVPQHGILILWQNLSAVEYRQQQLGVASRFTQANVNAGHLLYRYNGLPPSSRRRICGNNRCPNTIGDGFHFQLHAPGAISDTYEFRIAARVQLAVTRLINMPLVQVPEGEARVITSDNLFVEQSESTSSRSSTVFEFRVVRAPLFGQLNRVDPRAASVLEQNVTIFNTEQIANREIVYQHDDSESSQDSFEFTVSPRRDASSSFEAAGDLVIYIALRNDNPPQRASNATTDTFNLVISRAKCLTNRYLQYVDADIDQGPYSIVYTVTRLTNGFLFDAHNSSLRVTRFSQADIDRQRIMLQHSGSQVGRLGFVVSDEVHTVSGSLEIRASEPFIRIENNTRLTVMRNSEAIISTFYLSVETNLDVDADSIRFSLRNAPRYGSLHRRSTIGATEFTYQDVIDGQVRYRHDPALSPPVTPSSPPVYDSVAFHVSADNAGVDSEFYFMVAYTQANDGDRRLQVVVHDVLHVADGESAVLNNQILRIEDGVSDPKDILLAVTREPRAGRLYLLNAQPRVSVRSVAAPPPEYATGGNRALLIRMADIEEGRVRYQHTLFGVLSDSIGFAVTSKYQQRRDIEVLVSVREQPIAIVSGTLVADENSTTTLAAGIIRLHITNPLDNSTRVVSSNLENVTYVITMQPVLGRIVDLRQPATRLTEFGGLALSMQQIAYVHERFAQSLSSPHRRDSVTIAALWRSPLDSPAFYKQSAPQTLRINLRPAIARPPALLQLRNVTVWMSTKQFLLSTAQLEAVADDGGDADVEFQLVRSACGEVISRRTKQPVARFNQAELRGSMLAFVLFANATSQTESRFDCGFAFTMRCSIARYANLTSDVQFLRVRLIKPQIEIVNGSALVLKVFPRTEQPLRGSLLVKTNAASYDLTSKITYFVRSRPSLGRLLCVRSVDDANETKIEQVSEFTQDDVDSGALLYEHSNWTLGGWSMQDSFVFDLLVTDGSVVLYNRSQQQMRIDISIFNLYAADLQQFIFLKPLDVLEGGSKVLNGENFRSDNLLLKIFELGHSGGWIDFALVGSCQHGRITYSGITLFVNTSHSFTQQDIRNRFIAYQHDHSETRNDSCLLQVRLRKFAEAAATIASTSTTRRARTPVRSTASSITSASTAAMEVEQSVTIPLATFPLQVLVQQLNDHRVQQINTEQLSLKEGVVSAIDSRHLHAIDVDNLPDEIEYFYDEMSDRVRDQLRYASCSFLINGQAVGRFTQTQVNSGLVQMQYMGMSPELVGELDMPVTVGLKDPFSLSLPIAIKDGPFDLTWLTFRVRVEPIWLQLDLRPLEIAQGTQRVYLRNDSLRIQSSEPPSSVHFLEVTQPLYGELVLQHEAAVLRASEFTFQQVLAGQIYYKQQVMTAASDFFLFTLRVAQHAVYYVRMNIMVRSLVTRRRPLVLNLTESVDSRTVAITQEVLNADALWAKTDNRVEPIFTLAASPRFGSIRRIGSAHAHARFARSVSLEPTAKSRLEANDSFSYAEIRGGSIAYELTALPPRNQSESLQFIVSVNSPGIQPALEELPIEIASDVNWLRLVALFTPKPSVVAFNESAAPVFGRSGLRNEHIAAVVLCGGLLLLCVLLLVLVKFCRKSKTLKRASDRMMKNCGLPVLAIDNTVQKDGQNNIVYVSGDMSNSPLTPACFALCTTERRAICEPGCNSNGMFSSAPVTPCSPKMFPHLSDADDELGATSSGSDVPYGLPARMAHRSNSIGRSASRGASPPRHGILKNARFREREIAPDCFSADAQLNGYSMEDDSRSALPHVLISTPSTVHRELPRRLLEERLRKPSVRAFQLARKSQSITALQSKPTNISLPKLVFTDVDHYVIPSPPPPPRPYGHGHGQGQGAAHGVPPPVVGNKDVQRSDEPSRNEARTREERNGRITFPSDGSELSTDGSDEDKKEVQLSDSSTPSGSKKANLSVYSDSSSGRLRDRQRVANELSSAAAQKTSAKPICTIPKSKRETFVFAQFSTETDGESSSLRSAAARRSSGKPVQQANTVSVNDYTNPSQETSHRLLRQLALHDREDNDTRTLVL